MSAEDDDKKKKSAFTHPDELNTEDESGQGSETGDGGETGTGGQAGQVEFRDFLDSGQHLREDLLPDEIKRLLSTHDNINEANVKKQKDKRDQYKALREQYTNLKEGKMRLQAFREGLMGRNDYRSHPILSDKAQFSGIDRQVNAVPTENEANTNEVPRNKLENQFRLRHAPQSVPRFNPKPQIGR